MTQALPAHQPSEAGGHRSVGTTTTLIGRAPRERPWTAVHQIAAAAWVYSQLGTLGSHSCPQPQRKHSAGRTWPPHSPSSLPPNILKPALGQSFSPLARGPALSLMFMMFDQA